MHNRWKCAECGLITTGEEILEAPHPFELGEVVTGCPVCKSVESFHAACYVEGCRKDGTCGTPTSAGYFTSCFDHIPKENCK